MSYILASGECIGCHKLFSFNPEKVPTAVGHPVCRDCVTKANPVRKANGLEEFVVFPDSYGPQEV